MSAEQTFDHHPLARGRDSKQINPKVTQLQKSLPNLQDEIDFWIKRNQKRRTQLTQTWLLPQNKGSFGIILGS